MLKPTHTLPKPNNTKVTLDIHTYCDSDWAGCKQTRKSTTGTVTQILGCIVNHCSKTPATVLLSSTEAATYALGIGTAEALFMQQLLQETQMFTTVSVHIHTDSTGAKVVCSRTGLNGKTKHKQLRYLWLQETFTDKHCNLQNVGTLDKLR